MREQKAKISNIFMKEYEHCICAMRYVKGNGLLIFQSGRHWATTTPRPLFRVGFVQIQSESYAQR